MLISFIIINYNQNDQLQQLVQLIYPNLDPQTQEIIIIDNNSKNSIAYLKNQFPKLQLYLLTDNTGPSYARNFGVNKSRGMYLQFIDADDWIDPIKPTLQFNYAIKNNYPTLIASEWCTVDKQSIPDHYNIISYRIPSFKYEPLIALISTDGFIHLSSCLIKRESFLAVNGFDENQWLIEDTNLLIRLNSNFPDFAFANFQTPSFFYRIDNEGSLSKSNPLEFFHQVFKNAQLVYEILESRGHPLLKQESLELKGIYWSCLLSFLKYGDCAISKSAHIEYKKIPINFNPYRSPFKKLAFKLLGANTTAKIIHLINKKKNKGL